ncbi:MAG: PqqD family protein [Candidatus Rokubacteria bacterium]|nr:PqqD family protein [Candidatus Rokubacteria bacterium]
MVKSVEFTSSEQGVSPVPALDRIWARNPEFVSRRIGGEVLLLPIRQNMGDLESLFTLNAVGARVWELLDGGRRLGEIRDVIVAEFEVTPGQAEADLVDFIDKLAALEGVRAR